MSLSNDRRTRFAMAPVFASMIVGLAVSAASCISSSEAFTAPMFQSSTPMQKTAPSKTEGVEIELPNFDELFGRVQQVSPLARVAMQGGGPGEERGFAAADDAWPSELKWKKVESNSRRTVHQIDKIDNFQNLNAPILRFRSTLKGPCVGERFANFIMTLEEREKWDQSIAEVQEIYPIYDLDAANIAMGFGKYGDCSRLGVGYCRTKPAFGVTAREQLTLCGIQDFQDGSTVIWGTEMEDWHNHLLPPGERHTRAKSHLFCTTLVPTGPDSFDAEYVLQLDIGGKMPAWITTTLISESVKSLFKHAKCYFEAGEGGELDKYLKERDAQHDAFENRNGILFTP
uniref:START domain-containing protein n=1 Tax=Helicotheca tamesis TaxID=374047 RepID=A0A7S2H0S7_9STRA|mmetsp:Transcript_1413/g.2030  ORF Transcript_1413/g.2030 Transcript_1413/m.2030 type:complete len:343 (+) Transcript_1413:239-1267(+)